MPWPVTAALVGELLKCADGSSARSTVFGLGRKSQSTFRCM